MASEAGRELAYLHWSHDRLARAMVQAEDEIKGLEKLLAEATEERGQYYAESRRSAEQLGQIAAILLAGGLPQDSGFPEPPAGLPLRPPIGETRHQLDRAASPAFGGRCLCGEQYLVQAGRCVTQGPAGR